ncbi:MAG: hypothetical protein KGH78_05350, partial [Candidatus Micrarchaeota archaeon]|nr:hypothetical protein [Candidatus Micrarchaeota archaeon]
MAKKSRGVGFGLGDIKRSSDYRERIRGYEKILILIMLLSFVVFIAIAAFAILNEGVDTFVKSVESINLFYYLIAVVVVFAGYAVRFPKWEMYT